MKSLAYIPGSNGSANASLMTVQSVRTAPATTIVVNTVSGVSNKFYASMGTPHTFTDPVTGETITVVSEASAVDFAGHIDSGKLEIDAIAPGYTDLGSKVGDIVIIRPITEWANNIFNVLSQSHNDDGTLKSSAITYNANVFDHIASGGFITGDSYGSNRNASMTALVAYINGERQTSPAVTARTYTASKDTYVDLLYNASGVATVVYTEVANNAASPALASSSVRLGIIITGASSIANVGSVNQGEQEKTLPIVSSVAYSVTDSLGNLIAPRDPQSRTLGYRQRITSFATTSASAVQIPGLSVPVIIPQGRKVKITLFGSYLSQTGANSYSEPSIWEGAVGSGLRRQGWSFRAYTSGAITPFGAGITPPFQTTPGLVTFNASLDAAVGGSAAIEPYTGNSPTTPIGLLVELV